MCRSRRVRWKHGGLKHSRSVVDEGVELTLVGGPVHVVEHGLLVAHLQGVGVVHRHAEGIDGLQVALQHLDGDAHDGVEVHVGGDLADHAGAQGHQLRQALFLELLRQLGEHLALALGAGEVAIDGAHAGVGQGLVAVEVGARAVGGHQVVFDGGRSLTDRLGDLVLLVERVVDLVHLGLGDVHVDAAQGLGDLLEAEEVDHGIVLDNLLTSLFISGNFGSSS